MIDNPIIITGVPRSRTSLICRLLEVCGANFGPKNTLKGATKENINGYYENEKFCKELQKPYFEEILKIPILDRERLPSNEDILIEPDWNSKVNLYFKSNVTAIKDPKFCLYWEMWDWYFPNARWILSYRDINGILESVMNRTSWMDKKLGKKKWIKWAEHHVKRMTELSDSVKNIRWINTDLLLIDIFDQLRETVEWLGLKYNPECEKEIRRDVTFIS